MLGIRGAPDGLNGQNCVGTCGVGGVCGYSDDGGRDREVFLDDDVNNLTRLLFFLSVFPSVIPASITATNGPPDPSSTKVMVSSGSCSINPGRS